MNASHHESREGQMPLAQQVLLDEIGAMRVACDALPDDAHVPGLFSLVIERLQAQADAFGRKTRTGLGHRTARTAPAR